jgi:hypothetical protein
MTVVEEKTHEKSTPRKHPCVGRSGCSCLPTRETVIINRSKSQVLVQLLKMGTWTVPVLALPITSKRVRETTIWTNNFNFFYSREGIVILFVAAECKPKCMVLVKN